MQAKHPGRLSTRQAKPQAGRASFRLSPRQAEPQAGQAPGRPSPRQAKPMEGQPQSSQALVTPLAMTHRHSKLKQPTPQLHIALSDKKKSKSKIL